MVCICVRPHACERARVTVCVCVFYVGHPTMSNGPSLCAASCAELLPAVTLTHTNKRMHTAGEVFLGVPHPNTLHNAPTGASVALSVLQT